MSITDELRKYVQSWRETPNLMDELDAGDIDGLLGDFIAIADHIDAEHEAKVSYWRGASYKDGYKDGYDEGFASADDWLAQHEDAMAEHGWVKLPVDADGVPIRVGDVLTDDEYRFKVFELAAFGDGSWSIRNEDGNAWAACDVTHYHEPTVENVLTEFAKKITDSQIPGLHPTYDECIAEYAAKLRLAKEGE